MDGDTHSVNLNERLARLLGRRLGLIEALRESADAIIEDLADGCLVVLLDRLGKNPEVIVTRHRSVESYDALMPLEGARLDVQQKDGLSAVFRTGRSFAQERRIFTDQGGRYVPLIQEAPYRTDECSGTVGYLVLPLTSGERIVGAIVAAGRYSDEAKVTLKERSEFIAVASHELKNPLTSLKLSLQHVQSIKGEWDRRRVEQVVQNLLSNAAKYGLGRPVEVSVVIGQDGAEVSVRDHGVGIAPGDQKRVFQLFQRVSTERHVEGLGIGLFVVQEVARMHGGTIEIQSRPEEGSTFTLKLPLVPSLDINTAIEMHVRWLRRISECIEGSNLETLDPDQVRPDDLCTLGNWIYRLFGTNGADRDLLALRDVHSRFHNAAATVLEVLATKGRSAAEKLVLPGSEYAITSEAVIEHLEKLRNGKALSLRSEA